MPRTPPSPRPAAAALLAPLLLLAAPPAPAAQPPSPVPPPILDASPPPPSAETLLANLRRSIPNVPLSMQAAIRLMDHYGKPIGTIHADVLMNPRGAADHRTIRYTLHDPEETLSFPLATDPNTPIPQNPFAPIRHSEICWMELSFSFFWWPSPRLIGQEQIPGRGLCHILEIPVPYAHAPWDHIRLWIHPHYHAVLRGEAWKNGAPIKRFHVLSIRRVRNVCMIGSMEVVNLLTHARSLLQITRLDLLSPDYTDQEKALFNTPSPW